MPRSVWRALGSWVIQNAVEAGFLAKKPRRRLRGEEDHGQTGTAMRPPTDHPGGHEPVELVKWSTMQHLPEVVGDVEGGTKVDVVRLPVVGGDDLRTYSDSGQEEDVCSLPPDWSAGTQTSTRSSPGSAQCCVSQEANDGTEDTRNLLLFAPVQILTNGGPTDSTNFLMFDIYRNAFVFADLPLAAAETVLLLFVVFVIVGVQFKMLNQPSPGS